jgi:hypothetical protein
MSKKQVSRKNLLQSIANAKGAQAATKATKEFKVDKKHVAMLATKIVGHVKHHHSGLRDLLMPLCGERPETLEALKEAIDKDLKDWLKDEGRNINAQSVYNMRSDIVAALRAFQKYAGEAEAKRASFDKTLKGATSYHTFIKECRRFTKGKRGSNNDQRNTLQPDERRVHGTWKNHKQDAMKKAKDWLRFAPTDSLLSLIDFANDLVVARKKGNVTKMDGLAKAIKMEEQRKAERKAA